MSAWDVIRDVALTGTGIALLFLEAFSQHPSEVLVAAALALTAPSTAAHVKALLSAGGSSSSSSSSRHGPSQSG